MDPIEATKPRCWPFNGLLAPSDYAYNTNLVSGPCAEEEMDWARILAYITGTVDQELLSRNEYLVTENLILKRQLKGRLVLSDAERATLGEIGHRLGRKALADVANAAKPDTIPGWYRRLGARNFTPSNLAELRSRTDVLVSGKSAGRILVGSYPDFSR